MAEREVKLKVSAIVAEAVQAAEAVKTSVGKINQEMVAETKKARTAETDATNKAIKDQVDAAKSLAKQKADALKRDARDQLNAANSLARQKNAALKQAADEAAKADMEAARRAAEFREKLARDARISADREQRRQGERGMGDEDLTRRLKRAGAVAEEVGKKAKEGFKISEEAISTATTVAFGFFRALHQIGSEFDRVGQKSKEMSKNFASDRDRLRELAQLVGKTADDGFTKENHQFAKDAALSFDEAVSFRTEMMNTGGEHRGTRMSEKEYDEFAKRGAAYTAAKGIEPGAAGDLVGSVAGLRDFVKMEREGKIGKDQQAETALADVDAVNLILQRGRGDQKVLQRQFTETAAANLNTEDPLYGVFDDPRELAAVVSTAAEANPRTAHEQIRASIRGLRDFNGDAAPLLQAAGVDAKTPYTQAIEKIKPIVEKMAKDQGVMVQDVLERFFKEDLTKQSIATQLNKGVGAGVYADRRKIAKEAGGFAGADAVISQFQSSTTGQSRIADADTALAQSERAAKNSTLTVVRKQALNNLIRNNAIDTNATGINDYLSGTLSFGALGNAESKRIDDEVLKMLEARAPGGALKKDAAHIFNVTPEARENELRGYIEQITKANIDPLRAATGEENLIDRRMGIFKEDPNGGTFSSVNGVLDSIFGTAPMHPERQKPGFRPNFPIAGDSGDAGNQSVVNAIDRQTQVIKDVFVPSTTPPGRPLAPSTPDW